MATKNLGQVSAIHIGALEPQNKNLIWRDISQNPNLWKLWNSLDSVWEVVPSQTVVNNFINLGDTPISYQGSGGKILKVKANLSGIEFGDEVTFLSEINDAVNKAILDDSDEFLLSDAGTVKKTIWSNIKSAIKAYFDTLYVSVSDVTSQLIANWNTAYGWGDHASAGYLTSETDPVFTAHPANNVTDAGDGTQYLANDGTYKTITVPDGSKWEDESLTLIRPKDGKKVDASHIEGLGQGGHTFEDQSGTALPARSVAKAGAGIEFEDDAEGEMTVVRVDEDLTDHVDGADEVKHTANQIYGGVTDDNKIYYVDPTTKKLTPSNFTVDQILQLSSIDVTAPDWQVGEQRLVTVEKTIDEEPSLKGATQLVDLVLPPTTVTALEGATGWVGETRTLTGANFFGEIGRVGQRGTGPDGTIYVCTSAIAGTQGQTNGSATFKRNRSVDALDPENNTNDNNIANLLDPTRVGGNADTNWDVVNNVLIINTLVCRVGTWFTSGTGYFFMCYDRVGTNFYWRRIGQPQAIQRPINAANYPTLTSNLLAHNFTTGAYQNQSGDETNYQDQTFYDATTRRLFWQVKTGIWEEITINK